MANISRLTEALFPKNGVWITKQTAPNGYYVANYDAQSFTSCSRWFPRLDKAAAYAETLARAA